jgi:membrane fusion protein (multidrug efflux system)
MNKKLITNLIVLALIIAVSAMIYIQLRKNKEVIKENTELSQKVNDKIPVNVAEVSEVEFTNSFTTDGSFAPSQKTTVISDMPGKITQLNIKDGTYVTKGSVLAVLDNTLLQNQVKSTEATLSKLRRDLERYHVLAASGGITQQQIDDVTNGITLQEIQLSSVKKQIADTYLRAPISGVISDKKVEHGSYVSPGMPVAEIVNISPIKFQTYLTENQVFSIKTGQNVELSTSLYAGKDYEGKISLIDVESNPTKTFLVEILTSNPSNFPLKAGVSGKAYFYNNGSTKGIAIPKRSVVGPYNDAKTFVLEGDQVVLTAITLGKTNEKYVEVVSGLSPGQKVVTTGQINLKNGTKVEVVKELAEAQ